MTLPSITPGDPIIVLNAYGEREARRAITGVVAGLDFPVVWACRQEEWDAAATERRDPQGVPWPAEDVELASEHVNA
jgi:hypothetical protein